MDNDLTSDILIYEVLRNSDNEIIQHCNVKFIDKSVPAEEDNTIYVGDVNLTPRTELYDGIVYESLINIYVKTKQTDYLQSSRILRTIIKQVKKELKKNEELQSRNIRFGRHTFDYGSVFSLKGINLLVYVDEEEYDDDDLEEIENFCGIYYNNNGKID